MRRNLTGLRAIVTGASRGIGRLTAVKLAKEGCAVLLAARSRDGLESTAEQVRAAGGRGVVVSADLTTAEGRAEVVETATRELGGVDLLINNAGVASWGHFATSSEAILRQVMETNFFLPAEMIRAAMPLLEQGRTPAVVNVSSLCGRLGMPAWSEHSAGKHALAGLTEALRAEFVRYGVDVLLVVPGLTRSDDLSRHLLRQDGRANLDFSNATSPEVVANAIIGAIRTNRTETVVGSDARRLLLVHRLAPRFVRSRIAKKVRELYAKK